MAEPTYTVFVRVPIPRGDFVDPPPVNWESSKDTALWKILSGAAQREIDWNQVADRFNVPVDFLLQQVAYLTDRHASQVRAQVRKATAAARGSAAPSPVPGVDARTTSATSIQRDLLRSRHDGGSIPGTPLSSSLRPTVSRNTSTNTAVLREAGGSSSPRPAKPSGTGRTGEQSTGRRRLSSLPIMATYPKSPEVQAEPAKADRSPSPGPAESSSNESSEDESSPAQSRIIRRPPRFQQQQQGTHSPYGEDDDGDESEPAFQPQKQPSTQTSAQDLNSTLRGDGRSTNRRSRKGHRPKEATHFSQTSDSSAGSGALLPGSSKSREQRTPGPLSPQRQAEAGPAARSPSGVAKGTSHEGSEGTPSMGSSFSDLDDASVTQSALEEQMASHMNRGAGSRFSISQAIRSRYGPSSSNQ